MTRSKRLARQLKKNFEADIESQILIWQEQLPAPPVVDKAKNFFSAFPAFLDQIDLTFKESDERVEFSHRSLEVSSRELLQANTTLGDLNQTFKALINSLGQGFLLFDDSGFCLTAYSKSCETLLQTMPAGKAIGEVLKVPETEIPSFQDWLRLLFQEPIPFEDLAILGPNEFAHTNGLVIKLMYKCVRDIEGKVRQVVLIASDCTAEFHALREAEAIRSYADMVGAALRDRHQFADFVASARNLLGAVLLVLEQTDADKATLVTMCRNLHTLKGTAGAFGFAMMRRSLDEAETLINELPSWEERKNRVYPLIKNVSLTFEETLEKSREILGDFNKEPESSREISFNQLMKFAAHLNAQKSPDFHVMIDYFLNEFLALPLNSIFSRYERSVEMAAHDLGKKVGAIVLDCHDIRIIPEFYGGLWDNLSHIFVNMVDHGIESPNERIALAKSEFGTITVRASIESPLRKEATLVIAISDDGAGVNLNAIRKKLELAGRDEFAGKASDQELIMTIFDEGMTTKERATITSGRGIGLNSLAAEVAKLEGQIEVFSSPKKGTEFRIRVPVKGLNNSWNLP